MMTALIYAPDLGDLEESLQVLKQKSLVLCGCLGTVNTIAVATTIVSYYNKITHLHDINNA